MYGMKRVGQKYVGERGCVGNETVGSGHGEVSYALTQDSGDGRGRVVETCWMQSTIEVSDADAATQAVRSTGTVSVTVTVSVCMGERSADAVTPLSTRQCRGMLLTVTGTLKSTRAASLSVSCW